VMQDTSSPGEGGRSVGMLAWGELVEAIGPPDVLPTLTPAMLLQATIQRWPTAAVLLLVAARLPLLLGLTGLVRCCQPCLRSPYSFGLRRVGRGPNRG
jgi:hypothetical protein